MSSPVSSVFASVNTTPSRGLGGAPTRQPEGAPKIDGGLTPPVNLQERWDADEFCLPSGSQTGAQQQAFQQEVRFLQDQLRKDGASNQEIEFLRARLAEAEAKMGDLKQ